jgi:hypothetical protein
MPQRFDRATTHPNCANELDNMRKRIDSSVLIWFEAKE